MDKAIKPKVGCCQRPICTGILFVCLIGGIAAVVCVTFLSPDVRGPTPPPPPAPLEWWQKTIIYQVYPRSFKDSNDDGVGDLRGVIEKLDYFRYLGVGAVWLSPFFTSPMRDFGYDVSNYTEVDAIFGNMTDFEELMTEAHERGIKIIIDFVPNHTSNESAWFEASRRSEEPYKDFYVWNNGTLLENGTRVPPNNWKSVFEGTAWQWDEARQAYYYHAFLASQPDLNYRNHAVREHIKEVLKFWLQKGVDGFRIDAIPHLFEIEDQSMDEPLGATNGFDPNLHKYIKNQPEIFDVVREWRSILDGFGGDRFLLAETVGIPQEARMQYYEAGSVPFFFDLIPLGGKASPCTKSLASCFMETIRDGVNISSGQWPNFVIGNHDNPRIADRMGIQYVDALNMILLTLPGTPTTYYGEELGMHGGDYRGLPPKDPYAITSNNPDNSRDSERNPMQWDSTLYAGFTKSHTPWLPFTSVTNMSVVNVKKENATEGSSLLLYKELASLRQNPAFMNSKIDIPDGDLNEQVLMYGRGTTRGERYLVMAFLGNATSKQLNASSWGLQGKVVFATKLGRRDHMVKLNNVTLNQGEGLVVHLEEVELQA
ncbi:maltase A3-like [Mya arenaria]|uniref:maltase A3-like n=1 Tax=Mya arenaria TaxID=6604 RepID=UPI0022E036E4|nr:maltase A3-like [Mya arenaria]